MYRIFIKYGLTIFVIFIFHNTINAQILKVPQDYSTIQDGINASSDGDTVLVSPGLYNERINFNGKSITVASEYLTTQDTNYINQTIIDGDSLGSVVSIISGEDSTTLLSGISIQNGAADNGGGIRIINSSIDIDNCKINQNIAYLCGGGIYSLNSFPKISNSTISNNVVLGLDLGSHNYLGGGIYLNGSGGTIFNSNIIHNKLLPNTSVGGGVWYYESNTMLKNINISNNSSTICGGIFFIPRDSTTYCFSNLIFVNNMGAEAGAFMGGGTIDNPIMLFNCFFKNNFGRGGAAHVQGTTQFTNCTFIENSDGGSGIFANGPTYLTNCILYNSSPQIKINYYDYTHWGTAFLKSCNIYPNEITGYLEGLNYDDDYTIEVDPLFESKYGYDYYPSNNSQCVNSGTTDTTGLNIPTTDIIGNTRVFGGRLDMGAVENQEAWVSIDDISRSPFCVKVSPNPFKEKLFVEIDHDIVSDVKITLFSLAGQQKIEIAQPNNDLGGIMTIDCSSLNSGVYLLSVKTENDIIIKKLIKL